MSDRYFVARFCKRDLHWFGIRIELDHHRVKHEQYILISIFITYSHSLISVDWKTTHKVDRLRLIWCNVHSIFSEHVHMQLVCLPVSCWFEITFNIVIWAYELLMFCQIIISSEWYFLMGLICMYIVSICYRDVQWVWAQALKFCIRFDVPRGKGSNPDCENYFVTWTFSAYFVTLSSEAAGSLF